MNNYVLIGTIVNTHGIKGELRIISDIPYKDLVFIPNNNLYIGNNYQKEVIATYRVHKNYDMVTFKGYSNINEVLPYLKQKVYIKRDEIKTDTYIITDLLGFKVLDNNEEIGIVVDYINNNQQLLLKVKGIKDFYLPLGSTYIKEVDINNKVIITNKGKELIL